MKFLYLLLVLVGTAGAQSYLGFDRNDYPGDQNLAGLHKTFAYTGYWLNYPPGENDNTWVGKRKVLFEAGFGFLVLFNGRLYSDLKNMRRAEALGTADARAAVTAARREGFPPGTIIFLDQEQGGRMLPEQRTYLFTWIDAVHAMGFGTGIYCSGIPAKEGGGGSVVTAEDIRKDAAGRKIKFWVTNDACPPSPGCVFPKAPEKPALSGVDSADVWQFAQSPRRKDVAAGCMNYSSDGECYAPGVDAVQHLHVDLNTATETDPSHGRVR